uniref:Uncharacterized protein n=1 Tax=Anguilla anguilla TaxID=7936 RepID=A0A0E9WUQ6_ANGAN
MVSVRSVNAKLSVLVGNVVNDNRNTITITIYNMLYQNNLQVLVPVATVSCVIHFPLLHI